MAPEEFRYMQVPEERCASCHRCPKVEEEEFDPIYRCCTYHPRLPNFQIGWALENSETADKMQAFIAEGFASPEGLHVTPAQHVSSLAAHAEDRFGKAGDVFCRFLNQEKRQCGIYPYRNSVCSTFFCINDGGDLGEEFWQAMQNFMGQMETAVAQWAMEQCGIDPTAYFQRYDGLADKMDNLVQESGAWSAEAARELWGSDSPDIEAFYKACGQRVLDEREQLFELVADRKLLRPHRFDLAFRDRLGPALKAELDDTGGVGGDPIAPRDLWYQLDLAHRHLWQLPETGKHVKLSEKAQWQDREDDRYPVKLHVGKARLYLTTAEKRYMEQFSSPLPVNNDLVFGSDDVDGRRLLTEALAKGILQVQS